MMTIDETLLWDVRFFIYQHFVSTARPPSVDETADHFLISAGQAAMLYQELGRRHAIFLDPETQVIRMANPFSAVPTAFQVHAQGNIYWANCGWDALGIPAALHSDATIQASCAENGQPITLTVQNGRVTHHGERIHFLLPFSRWYDDLILT
ncbi:MAG: hypothetical protein HZB51_16035 [Chloroflexi bacterium]|nr:hypothetical protein [Chloroflexota bacterium]